MLASALLALGWEQALDAEQCDLMLLNTCTVTGEADTKNRKAIRSLLRRCDAPLLVTGCAINIDADFYADLDPRISCESDKSKVVDCARRLVAKSAGEVQCALELEDLDLLRKREGKKGDFRTRVDLKIQDGCDNACSYCIVHVARGPAHSVPSSIVLEQADALAKTGTEELVLVGIDLAAYDDGAMDLAMLTDQILARTDIGRVRISSVEPQSITPALIEAFGRSNGRLCRHLHLCLQSGCDKTLREMNRHYDSSQFKKLVDQLFSAAPRMALSTDVIVGFPGETDEDFERSYRFIEDCAFMRLHVFRYSKRPGTPAAQRSDQVEPKTKTRRSEALIALGDRLMLADMQRRIGTTEQVVIERPGIGTSESYHVVSCNKSIPVGALVPIELYDLDVQHKRFIGH